MRKDIFLCGVFLVQLIITGVLFRQAARRSNCPSVHRDPPSVVDVPSPSLPPHTQEKAQPTTNALAPIVYLVKTYAGSKHQWFPDRYRKPGYAKVAGPVGKVERHLWLCSNENSTLPSLECPDIFEGYGLPLTYKIANCMRQLCSRYSETGFALVQIDDDVALRPDVTQKLPLPGEDRNLCDRRPNKVAESVDSLYFVDNPKLYGKKSDICLGYFWYIAPPSTERICQNLHLLRHYRPDDVSFTLFYEYIGLTFEDIGSEKAHPECSKFQTNPFVSCVQCHATDACLREKFLW